MISRTDLAALVFVLSFAGAARAEDDTSTPVVEDVATVTSNGRPPGIFGVLNAPPVHVELSLDHAFHTPFRDFPGSMTVTRDSVSVGTWLPLPGTFLFGLDLDAEGSRYIESKDLVVGDVHLDQTLYQISVGPKIVDRVNDDVTLYVGTVFFFAGALDAEVKDSLRYELDLAVQIRITDEFTLTVGAGVRTGIETRPSLYPIIAVEWPRFKISLEGGILKASVAFLQGVSGAQEVGVFSSFGIDLREYRLAEYSAKGQVAPAPGAVVQDIRYPLTVGMSYEPVTGLRFDVSGGVNFFQKLEIDDHLGRALGRAHARPAPFVVLLLAIDI